MLGETTCLLSNQRELLSLVLSDADSFNEDKHEEADNKVLSDTEDLRRETSLERPVHACISHWRGDLLEHVPPAGVPNASVCGRSKC